MYAEVVFPLPFRNSFTYKIPKEFEEQVQLGVRVVCSFGRRVLTGFVINVTETTKVDGKVKSLGDVLDDQPIFSKESLEFYKWIADYYMSSLGEALKNSVPYGLDVESKKKIVADKEFCLSLFAKQTKPNSTKAKLLKLLSEKEIYSLKQLQKLVKKKSIYSTLKSLEGIGAISIINEIEEQKVKVKKAYFVKIDKPLDVVYGTLPEIEKRSPKQVVILLELLSIKNNEAQQSELLKKTKTNQSSIKSLEQKGLVKVFPKEVERIYKDTYSEEIKKFELTDAQTKVINSVAENIDSNSFKPFLLHGVTGSGKTQVYIELTRKAIDQQMCHFH